MNFLRNDDSSEIEAELRALLRRRSAHVDPDQPEWQDLVERRPAAVYSLYDGGGDRGSVARPWRPRPKPVFIAAAVVAVVLAGGVAAKSTTDSDGSPGLNGSPASFSVAAPTEDGFDARTAAAVFTSDAADPVAAAQAYLAETGVSVTGPSTPATPGQPSLELLSNADGVAVVEWTAVEGSVSRTGTVHLRANPAETAGATGAATWSVVASTVDGIALTDVGYDGERLSFTVTKTAPAAGPLAVGVWSDGRQVAVDGDAVEAAAGAAGDAVGAGAGTDDGAAGAGAAVDGDSVDAAAGAEQATAAAGLDQESLDAGAAADDAAGAVDLDQDSLDAGAAAHDAAGAVDLDEDALDAEAGAGRGVGAGTEVTDDAVQAGGAVADGGVAANVDPAVEPPSLQTVDIPDDPGSSAPLTAVVDQASTAVIQVQQLVDGQPAGVTSMAVALPGADAAAGADVAGSGTGSGADAGVDVEGDAGATVPTTTGPAAPLEGAGEAVDEIEDAVRGGTTAPPADDGESAPPTLPTTLPSVPTTLPAPPSGGRMP